MSNEMQKFRDMLDEKGIPWHDASEWDIVRTHADDGSFSVICGPYTYGGCSGLLEIMSDKIKKMHKDGEYDDDVIGCLTAEEVFDWIDVKEENVGASAKKSIDIEGHVNVVKEIWADDFSGESFITVELVYPDNEASDVAAALVEEALHPGGKKEENGEASDSE